jgi:anthranilate synthase component 1
VLRPTSDEFERLARPGKLIPVVREIQADLDTPLSLFRRLDDGHSAFLFESVEGGEKWARYSFIGTGARAVFESHGRRATWTERGETREIAVQGDPLLILRERLAAFEPATPAELELPRFSGGAVGAISWDWVRFVERIPDENPDELGFPDVRFVIPETVVVFDNVRHSALIVREVEIRPEDDVAARYEEAERAIEAVARRLKEPLEEDRHAPVAAPMDVATSRTRDTYQLMVKRAKEYIEAGDIFQVVLSQRFSLPLQVDPFLIYRHLRRINPSPYLIFLRAGDDRVLIGSSPEILVRMEDGKIDLRPIAGTRPRGATPDEDRNLEEELLADPKELAEHVMLVDLGRNDVGRVARVGSVRVSEYALIERYSHVMHIVSNVEGRIRPELDWLDLLRATFPAGTLSGAPKVRAMEIIDELESSRRGPYGGCVGYVDYSGNMDMAITIRTMLVQDGRIFLQAGGGIVADSDPEAEYQESLNKARALIQAIDMAREGSD